MKRSILSQPGASRTIDWMRILALLSCMMVSPIALAEAGWSGPVRVIELVPTGRHYFEVKLALERNPSGCRDESWFYLNYDTPGTDKMFELFVDGLKKSLRLRVYVTGNCNISGYSEISAVSASAN